MFSKKMYVKSIFVPDSETLSFFETNILKFIERRIIDTDFEKYFNLNVGKEIFRYILENEKNILSEYYENMG
jgi:hypothetical protein